MSDYMAHFMMVGLRNHFCINHLLIGSDNSVQRCLLVSLTWIAGGAWRGNSRCELGVLNFLSQVHEWIVSNHSNCDWTKILNRVFFYTVHRVLTIKVYLFLYSVHWVHGRDSQADRWLWRYGITSKFTGLPVRWRDSLTLVFATSPLTIMECCLFVFVHNLWGSFVCALDGRRLGLSVVGVCACATSPYTIVRASSCEIKWERMPYASA